MESVLDKEWRNVAAIKTLLDSPGWKIYEEKILDLFELEKHLIDLILSEYVSEDKREMLNRHLAKKQILERILIIKEELVEEVEDGNSNSPEDGEQNTSLD